MCMFSILKIKYEPHFQNYPFKHQKANYAFLQLDNYSNTCFNVLHRYTAVWHVISYCHGPHTLTACKTQLSGMSFLTVMGPTHSLPVKHSCLECHFLLSWGPHTACKPASGEATS